MNNSQSELGRINRVAWNSPDAARLFMLDKTFSDPGERAAFAWLTPRCAGEPLLDIGIGAGRTIALMTAISNEYTGAARANAARIASITPINRPDCTLTGIAHESHR